MMGRAERNFNEFCCTNEYYTCFGTLKVCFIFRAEENVRLRDIKSGMTHGIFPQNKK